MPKEFFGADFPFLPRDEILSYEEIFRLARIFHRLGVRKFRITGGEPLLRRDLAEIIEMLATLPDVDLALTTNGALLAEHAEGLAAAGLHRVTVSLDSLDNEVFQRMNDVRFPVERVLAGIEAAETAGLGPVKVNVVVKRGVNDESIVELARHFRGTRQIVRFIEFMDVGTTNGWELDDVVAGAEVVSRIERHFAVEPVNPNYAGEVATRWRYKDGKGEIGVITSVSRPFCGDCSRVRLSTDGKLFTCLFAASGTDLRGPLREGWGDQAIEGLLREVWGERADRYSEIRSGETVGLERMEMSYLGG
jgi:cyclic pyranopterin phosphate synthase